MSSRQSAQRNPREIFIEIVKWALVIWLLWPLGGMGQSPVSVLRIVTGIALFVIFGGKVLYDVIILDYMKQKRESRKKDLITLLGIVLVSAMMVGLFMIFTTILIVMLMQQAQNS